MIMNEKYSNISNFNMRVVNIGVVTEAGLRQPSKIVGVESSTPQDVREELENIRNFETDTSDFQPPVAFTPENDMDYNAFGLLQINESQWPHMVDRIKAPPIPDWELKVLKQTAKTRGH